MKVPSFLGMPKDFRPRKYHRMKFKKRGQILFLDHYINRGVIKNINTVKQQRLK